MEYSEATGSYQSEFLEKILDTNYLYGVPYKIDRGKYEAVMAGFSKKVRIKDADVVVFSSDYNADEDDPERGIYSYSFFAFPQNSPDGSEDFYDVAQFWDWDYENNHKKLFEKFVHAILESVVGVDVPTVMNLREKKSEELRHTFKEIDELNNIILSAK